MNDLIWHRFVTLSAPFFQFPPPYIFFVYVAKISSKLGTMSKVCSRQIFPSSHTTYIVKRNRKDQCDIPLCNGYLWNLQNLLLELSLGHLTFLDNIPYQRNILLLTMYSHANFFALQMAIRKGLLFVTSVWQCDIDWKVTALKAFICLLDVCSVLLQCAMLWECVFSLSLYIRSCFWHIFRSF